MGRLSWGCPFGSAARQHPARVALVFEGQRWTWAEVEREVRAAESWLRGQGVGAGDRVVVVSANRPHFFWLFGAAARLGASLVPINVRLSEREQAALIERASPKVVLRGLELEKSSAQKPTEERRGFGSTVLDPHRPAVMLFTSGTTGTPKLVPLTNQNFRSAAEASRAHFGLRGPGVWLGTLPLFHIGGLAMFARVAWEAGTLVLDEGFDAARCWKLLEQEKVTHFSLVPTTLQRLLEASPRSSLASLKVVLVGGGPMGPALLAGARDLGLPVVQTYGLTEACSQVCTERLSEADGTTAGVPLPGLEVRIVNDEIEVRGPTVAAHVPTGEWLQTRDVGLIDERGRLKVLARRVDLIVSGGENISPLEIETQLAERAEIADVVVVPVADQQWGQVPVAVVKWRSQPAQEQVSGWLRDRVAGYKVPKRWVAVEEVPRNALGKADRLAARALAERSG